MKNMKKRIVSLALVVVMVLTTFLPGVGTLPVEAAETTGEHMVVTSPWAYYNGSMTTEVDAEIAAKGYERVTTVAGTGQNLSSTRSGALMRDMDLTCYNEFRFALKTNGEFWYEICYEGAGYDAANLFAGSSSSWVEYSFKYEGDSNGKSVFRLYKDGNYDSLTIEVKNLADLQMRFSDSGAAVLYMTEVRGILKEGAEPSLKFVADSFNTNSGTITYAEKPNVIAKKSTQVTTSWSGTESPLASVDLSKFDKVIFYARGVDNTGGWFQSHVLWSPDLNGEEQGFVMNTSWIEFKVVKNSNDKWDIYTGGVVRSADQTLSNLSELSARYGDKSYYFSEVYGVYSDGVEIPILGEHMVVTSPWAYYNGSMTTEVDAEIAPKGYERVTTVAGTGQNLSSTRSGALMRDMDLTCYNEFRFALKTNGSFWYEICYEGAGYDAANLFAGSSSNWVEYSFKYEGDSNGKSVFRLYKDGNYDSLTIEVKNLSDLQMRFSDSGDATLYMTEVRGTLKEGAAPSLKYVADSFYANSGTITYAEKPNVIAKKSTKVTTSWSGTESPLASVDLSEFDKVIFYARGVDNTGGWFQSHELWSPDLNGEEQGFVMNTSWIEFKVVRNSNDKWDIYTGGVLRSADQSLSNLSELSARYGDKAYYFSEVYGVYSDGADDDEPDTPVLTDQLIVTTPWSYHDGVHHNPRKFSVLDKSEAYVTGGYEYATIIPGGQAYWDAPLMQDADMSIYSKFRFAVKTNGDGYWYEVCKESTGFGDNGANNLFAGAGEEWLEYSFVYEDDGAGNAGYRMYKDGNFQSVLLPADLNLSDLQMRFTSDTNGLLYMTEVRGTLKEGASSSLQIVAGNFHGLGADIDGATVNDTSEKPNGTATYSTLAPMAWRGDANNNMKYFPLANVPLMSYEKILFYTRKPTEDSSWLQSDLLGSFVVGTTWTEFKLEKNANDNWDIYVAGKLYKTDQALSNLAEITVAFGTSTYYFSEVFGVLRSDVPANAIGLVQTLKAKAKYKMNANNYDEKYDLLANDVINWQDVKWVRQEILDVEHEYMVISSPWAYHDSVHHNPQKFSIVDRSQTYVAGGYEYATIIPGGQVYWDAPLMQDADMSIYSEFRFAVKTNGSGYWYEVCKESTGFGENGANDLFAGADEEWVEYSFKYEDDGAGNAGYRMYKNGNFQSVLLPADMNLSDLQMRFTSNTSGLLYMTEVRGILKEDVKLPLEVVTSSFNAESGTPIEKDDAIIDATMSTRVNCSWSQTRNSLTSVDLSLYDKILFYARKSYSDFNTEAWIESAYLGSFVISNNWTEFKMVKNDDGTWNIYAAGKLTMSNQTLTNLSDITATYGDDTYDFSEVFGISSAAPIVLLDDAKQALYSVVYSGSNEAFAANEFTTYMNDATGANYTATEVSSAPEDDAKNIVIGADLATKAGFNTSELSTDNGYAIKRKGDNLYIFGKTTQGTLNGVYALLKDIIDLEIYTDKVSTNAYESGSIVYDKKSVVFNPTIDYVYDMNRETRDNGAYRKKLGFTVDWEHLGGSDHEEGEFINSSYYSGTTTNGHVDLASETTQEQVAQYLYDKYVVGRPDLSNFRFGLTDDTKWFTNTNAGPERTAQYVKFMNAVAQELQALMDANNAKRDINLILLAYLSTVQAPTDGTTFANTENITLQVAYAPLEANWYVPLSHGDNDNIPSEVSSSITYDADVELQKWAGLAGDGNVLLWAYHAFPGNYLTPFDSLNALQKNYALAAQCGVSAVYDIAQWAPDGRDGATLGDGNDTSTDWTRLKVYLSNELAKNPTMSDTEYNQLIDNFMNAYFIVEEVATAMKEALRAERALMEDVYANVKTIEDISYNETCDLDDYYGTPGGYHTLIDQTVTAWNGWGSKNSNTRNAAWGWSGSGDHPMMPVYRYMKEAYDAVDSASIDDTQKAILKERIQLEAISVRFILLRVAGKDVSSDFGGSAEFAGLANDCINLGVTKVGENSSGINRDMTAENLNKDDL